jgi:DNA primase large subunit
MKRLHFTEYIRLALANGDKKWKFSKRAPHRGYIEMSDAEYAELTRTKKRAYRPPKPPPPPPKKVKAAACPPCIAYLMKQAAHGVNLPHTGRFAVVSFMKDIGVILESLQHVFAESPDYDEEHTTYQIEHIYSHDYKSPSCEWMAKNHLCINKDSDCEKWKVGQPIYYYKKKHPLV